MVVIKNLVAIDPGEITGFALFRPETAYGISGGVVLGPMTRLVLHECGITKGRYLPSDGPFHVAIERPQADDRRTSTGKPVPLSAKMTLAWNAGKQAGWYEAFGHNVAEIEPRQWKAQLSKDQCWEQVRAKLTPGELSIVSQCEAAIADSYRHNMRDAIGIGMAVLGRFRVRP